MNAHDQDDCVRVIVYIRPTGASAMAA